MTLWHNANIKTFKVESVASRVERRFAAYSGISSDILRTTFTGEHRRPSVASEMNEERAITRGSEKAESEDAKALWARIEKKHRINSRLIIHCPTSEGVSEVSERVSAAEGASEASSPEQANE